MTDTDIIKALECCSEVYACDQCPYYNNGEYTCRNLSIFKESLDLINRQKAEIEAYKHYYNECLNDLKNAHVEIEELREINDCRTRDMPLFYATAIREFAENLTQDIKSHRLEMSLNGLKGTHRTDEMTYETIIEYIDNLVKEMTEGV